MRTPSTRASLAPPLAILLALLVCVPALAQQPSRDSTAGRIVVVADVHGAYSELVALLQAAGVVDASLRWAGGDTRLVSLGDLLDRGPDVRKVLDLMMRLQNDARARGGAVHVVLGNHELMNLMGDLRYVTAADYDAFAADEPIDLRFAAYARFVAERPDVAAADSVAEFERLYPRGFFARRLAFRADGRYGVWLLSLPAVLVIDERAFVHGGLPETLSGGTPVAAGLAHDPSGTADRFNELVRGDLRRYLDLRDRLAEAHVLRSDDMQRDAAFARGAREALAERSPLAQLLDEFIKLSDAPELGVGGPLWYRGSVYCNPFLEEPLLAGALETLGVARAVVGHTPTDDRRVRELYDGRLVMLDTGMLTGYYMGRPSALVIAPNRTYVQYLNPAEQLPLERGRIEAYGLTEPEIVQALATGDLVPAASEATDGAAARRLDVRYGERVLRAVFYPPESARVELAAHALDRLLGWQLVPPTVERELDGEQGALRLVYPDAVSETERAERNVALGGWCSLGPQSQLLSTFDGLIYNVGRTRDNVVYRRESSVLKSIAHPAAFGTGRPPLREIGETSTAELVAQLESLDQRKLQAALGEWLDGAEIRAILTRRAALLREPRR